MGQLAAFLFSVSGVVTALLVAALWVWRRPTSRGARRFLLSVAIFYWLASTYVVAVAATRLLTIGYHRFEAADVRPGATAVVVLGAGNETVVGWEERERMSVMNEIGSARVLEAYRVIRLIDPAVIVSSGGNADPGDTSQPSSIIMRDVLVGLGVPASRIVLESTSRDTHDEAVAIVPMMRAMKIDQVVLVTSDVHMRRSIGAFRAVGCKAVPAIAPDPRWILPPLDRWHPTHQGLSLNAEVIHELLGIPYYWLRGWWR